MYKKDVFSDPQTNSKFRKFREFREIPDTFVIRKFGKFVPKKHVFTEYALRSRYLEFWGKSFSDIFPKCHKLRAKKCKTQKNAKVSRKHPKFWVFYRIGCGDLSKHWKSVENDQIPVHTQYLFFFRGFRDFQLRIEVKFRKRRFFRRFKILRFTGWGRRFFLHGAKIWTAFFFEKWNTFSVLGPILCCFYSENPDENDDD
jgi:hypothetical protein